MYKCLNANVTILLSRDTSLELSIINLIKDLVRLNTENQLFRTRARDWNISKNGSSPIQSKTRISKCFYLRGKVFLNHKSAE